MPLVWLTPLFLSCLSCLILSGVILLKRSRGPVEKALVAILGSTAWIQASTLLGILDSEQALMWKQLSMAG